MDYIKEQLQIRDIACFDYRSLFNQAHNLSKIALLPEDLEGVGKIGVEYIT